MKRIDVFMNREELKSKVEVVTETGNGKPEAGSPKPEAATADAGDDAAIEINDGTFQWESDQVC